MQAALTARDDPVRALPQLTQQEYLLRDLDDLYGLAACLGNQGIALSKLERLTDALTKFTQQEQICREVGLSDGLANTLLSKADILRRTGAAEDAMRCAREGEAISQKCGNIGLAAKFIMLQATIEQANGRLVEAIRLFKQCEALFAKSGQPMFEINAKFQQSVLYGQHVRSVAMGLPGMRKALRLAEERGFGELAESIRAAINEAAASG
jgi:tetratricopeptide (TPR) repeat protein